MMNNSLHLLLLLLAAVVVSVPTQAREAAIATTSRGQGTVGEEPMIANNYEDTELAYWDDLLDSSSSVHDIAAALNRRLQQSSSLSSSSSSPANDFNHVCQELRTIFHEQCSCGGGETIVRDGIGNVIASNELLSDQVACDYSDIHAIALFSQDLANDPFQVQKMNSLKVCKHPNVSTGNRSKGRVCTTIYYSDNVGTHCDVMVTGDIIGYSYGTTDEQKCENCEMCQTTKGLMGLQIDCNNIDPKVSTYTCTAATQILDLSDASSFACTTTAFVVLLLPTAVAFFFLLVG